MARFPSPPNRTAYPQAKTPQFFSWGWTQWFQSIADLFNVLVVQVDILIVQVAGLIAGSNVFTVRFESANYNAVPQDLVLADTSGGGFNVIVPAAAANSGLTIIVKKVSGDGNTLNIQPTGADTIDGSAIIPIVAPQTSISLIADGVSMWDIV